MDNMTTTNYKGFKIVSEKVGKFGTSTRYRSGKLIAPRKKDVISEIDRLLDRKKIIDYEIQRLDRFTEEQGDKGAMTKAVIDEAMRVTAKDVIRPKVVRDGFVKPQPELTVREVLEWMNNSKKDCYLFEMYKDGSGEIDNEQNATHTMFGSLDELTKIIRHQP